MEETRKTKPMKLVEGLPQRRAMRRKGFDPLKEILQLGPLGVEVGTRGGLIARDGFGLDVGSAPSPCSIKVRRCPRHRRSAMTFADALEPLDQGAGLPGSRRRWPAVGISRTGCPRARGPPRPLQM